MARQIGKDDMAPQKCPRDDFCSSEDFQRASCQSPLQGGAAACMFLLAACSRLSQTQQVGLGVLICVSERSQSAIATGRLCWCGTVSERLA